MTTSPPPQSSSEHEDYARAWVPHGHFVVAGARQGLLNGLRFAVKDVFDVAGHPTGAGNPVWLATHPVPHTSSPIVTTLLADAATLESWRQVYVTASAYDGWQVHGKWISENQPDFGPAVASRWQSAAGISADAAAQAMQRRQDIARQISNFLGQDGVAIIPSAASVAPLLTATGAEVDQVRTRTFRITCIAGLAGLPQVSLPFSTDAGLPIGVSLLGPAGSDLALIRLATALWQHLQT